MFAKILFCSINTPEIGHLSAFVCCFLHFYVCDDSCCWSFCYCIFFLFLFRYSNSLLLFTLLFSLEILVLLFFYNRHISESIIIRLLRPLFFAIYFSWLVCTQGFCGWDSESFLSFELSWKRHMMQQVEKTFRDFLNLKCWKYVKKWLVIA